MNRFWFEIVRAWAIHLKGCLARRPEIFRLNGFMHLRSGPEVIIRPDNVKGLDMDNPNYYARKDFVVEKKLF